MVAIPNFANIVNTISKAFLHSTIIPLYKGDHPISPMETGPDQVVFTVVNKHTSAIKALLTRGCGLSGWSPHPIMILANNTEYDEIILTGFDGIGGSCDDSDPKRAIHLDVGKVDVNETIRFLIPSGWHGKMSVGDANYHLTGGSETLLEGSFLEQVNGNGETKVKLDFDVSMVDGFSVPLTCSCGDEVLTGCSWDLLSLNRCPEEDQGDGVCRNPLRPDESVSSATEFFQPCEGAAYTFPHDHGANINGNPQCQSEGVTCCVGTDCDPHMNQCTGVMSGEEICQKFY
ncbi:hypothetical protein BKA67DRAFT_681650 [Truncatella angustata]|uniref:Uncharacterized protein n=1 Tax=Truncatella angustata TaxID=152316 RepID=A0A9P8UER3_9PEZI|nr:uncharacterized protein BKA67DRAFT_681650 [Truncatella angustata]KAH6648567.1 hypothetical protein BKA67DRAFT_681650 [Truncatella angustata]KAH8193733.1 hypothetical protein TruAng_012101 [Truncatella angustata]